MLRLLICNLAVSSLILLGACAPPADEQAGQAPGKESAEVVSEAAFQKYNSEHQQKLPLEPAPQILDVEHRTVHHDPAYFSAHPRWGVYQRFGSSEMIVAFKTAPSDYKRPEDVMHGGVRRQGYEQKAVILLKRSTDGGLTWPAENDVILYDEKLSDDEKRAFLYQKGAVREQFDMFSPDSVFWFTHTYLHDEERMVLFALRSADRGKTWEKVPTVIDPPSGHSSVRKKFSSVIRRPDGTTLITVMNAGGAAPIYESTDQGLSWRFVAYSAALPGGVGAVTYDGLIEFPIGELQSYYVHALGKKDYTSIHGVRNAIAMSSSTDGGRTWTDPMPIVGKGDECWSFPAKRKAERESFVYRSPFPILLQDGRILVVWARRRIPFGMGGTLSSDGGKTWSHEFIIRSDDTNCHDIGYPIGGQLEDGRVFISYYYSEPDKSCQESVRYIESTFFRVE